MEINTYKLRLQDELQKLHAELSTIASHNETTGDWEAKPEAPAETSDENMAADAAEDGIERQGAVAALETRYRNIKRALTKIEDGTFATCELCSDIIEEDRLMANAAARTCIADRDREAELPL
jgi:RNA polymerase-binding transcription factor DksA